MKFMFWNIRDFGRAVRRKQIRDIIWKESLDGVGLQETIKGDFTQKDLNDIAGGFNSDGSGKMQRATRGGGGGDSHRD
jgi:hypothetical protein